MEKGRPTIPTDNDDEEFMAERSRARARERESKREKEKEKGGVLTHRVCNRKKARNSLSHVIIR